MDTQDTRRSMSGGPLEKFKIRAPLRCEGVGTLDCAEDMASGARMAIRWLPLTANGESAAQQIETLPLHRALPRIRETGRLGASAYVALDFPEGKMLATLLDRPLATDRLQRILSDVAPAIALLHTRGQVHGELCPDSILLLGDGAAMLWDLPLVLANRFTDRRGEQWSSSQLARLAPCLAPERARGEGPSTPADVYGLGATLLLAAGIRLPEGSALSVLHQIASGAWKPQLSGEVQGPLEALLAKMVSPDPAARPTAQGILDAIDAMNAAALRTATVPDLRAVVVSEIPAPHPRDEVGAAGSTGSDVMNADDLVLEAKPAQAISDQVTPADDAVAQNAVAQNAAAQNAAAPIAIEYGAVVVDAAIYDAVAEAAMAHATAAHAATDHVTAETELGKSSRGVSVTRSTSVEVATGVSDELGTSSRKTRSSSQLRAVRRATREEMRVQEAALGNWMSEASNPRAPVAAAPNVTDQKVSAPAVAKSVEQLPSKKSPRSGARNVAVALLVALVAVGTFALWWSTDRSGNSLFGGIGVDGLNGRATLQPIDPDEVLADDLLTPLSADESAEIQDEPLDAAATDDTAPTSVRAPAVEKPVRVTAKTRRPPRSLQAKEKRAALQVSAPALEAAEATTAEEEPESATPDFSFLPTDGTKPAQKL